MKYRIVDWQMNVLASFDTKDEAVDWIKHARVGEPYLRYYRIDIRIGDC